MSKKEFKAVPQIEIDEKLYHETAEVVFSIVLEQRKETVGLEEKKTNIWKLKKGVVVGDRVFNEKVVRSELGREGREVIKCQLDIEVRKELNRLTERE